MFSRKQYELIADAIHEVAKDVGEMMEGPTRQATTSMLAVKMVVTKLGAKFQEDNPNFDAAVFYKRAIHGDKK